MYMKLERLGISGVTGRGGGGRSGDGWDSTMISAVYDAGIHGRQGQRRGSVALTVLPSSHSLQRHPDVAQHIVVVMC